jgi:hypothetical protein
VQSYVGVCLVLALLLIRNSLRATGLPVGPVLMLSYKNHALDEFLADVVSAASSSAAAVNAATSSSSTFTAAAASWRRHGLEVGPGFLIRTGTAEKEELKQFAERRSQQERRIQEEVVHPGRREEDRQRLAHLRDEDPERQSRHRRGESPLSSPLLFHVR